MGQQMLDETKGNVSPDQLVFIQLDVSSLASVREFAKNFIESKRNLHLLVCNAGAFFTTKALTKDGLDMCLASNHFGHFLLTQLLLPTILATEAKGAQPRIVMLSSALA